MDQTSNPDIAKPPKRRLLVAASALLLTAGGVSACGDEVVSCDTRDVIIQPGDRVWDLTGGSDERVSQTESMNPGINFGNLQPGDHVKVCFPPDQP